MGAFSFQTFNVEHIVERAFFDNLVVRTNGDVDPTGEGFSGIPQAFHL